jgi:maltose O-acetyltransferase
VGKGENIEIGNYCQVNENVQLSNVRLGNYVMIAPGVTILGRMHQHSDTTIPMVLQGEIDTAQTIIEDDVWIGTNAIIMPGLTIQKGCIIAAGAVVTKNCQSYGIYGGVPATLLKIRK